MLQTKTLTAELAEDAENSQAIGDGRELMPLVGDSLRPKGRIIDWQNYGRNEKDGERDGQGKNVEGQESE